MQRMKLPMHVQDSIAAHRMEAQASNRVWTLLFVRVVSLVYPEPKETSQIMPQRFPLTRALL